MPSDRDFPRILKLNQTLKTVKGHRIASLTLQKIGSARPSSGFTPGQSPAYRVHFPVAQLVADKSVRRAESDPLTPEVCAETETARRLLSIRLL